MSFVSWCQNSFEVEAGNNKRRGSVVELNLLEGRLFKIKGKRKSKEEKKV